LCWGAPGDPLPLVITPCNEWDTNLENLSLLARQGVDRIAAGGLGRMRGGHRFGTLGVPRTFASHAVAQLRQRGVNVAVLPKPTCCGDREGQHAQDLLRLSIHYFNTETEADSATDALAQIVNCQ
jgi:selenocysteine lyase/cysteine desulfurase